MLVAMTLSGSTCSQSHSDEGYGDFDKSFATAVNMLCIRLRKSWRLARKGLNRTPVASLEFCGMQVLASAIVMVTKK